MAGKIEKVIEDVKKILKKDTRGLTIQELADATKVSRITVAMALMNLEGANIVDVRALGNCKLHYLTPTGVPRKILEKNLYKRQK